MAVVNKDYCLGCMAPKGNSAQCAKCGYIDGTPRLLPALAPGTVLNERYLVGKRIGSNGEGITYIGMDLHREQRVTIREYLPHTLCSRSEDSDEVVINSRTELVYNDYLADFLEISRAVMRLGDVAAVVPVLDIFKCNNTAYVIYKYIPGTSLTELVKRTKRLSWDEAQPIFMPLISTMVSAHAIGLVHFGLSPETIMMTKDGRLVITGFGVPDARVAETDLKAELFEGFSAIEQYAMDCKKGKWTDVYSICAVLLYALTGKRPPDAVSRSYEPRLNIPSELAESIPAYVVTALAGGLQVHGEKRTSSMEQLKSELSSRSGAEAPGMTVSAASRPTRPEPPTPRSRPQPAAHRMSENAERSSDKDSQPWYMKLSQIQYLILSTCLGIIVLGTIAIVVFLSVRDLLPGKNNVQASTITFSEQPSATDVTDPVETYAVPKFLGKKWTEVNASPDFIMFDLYETASSYSDDYAEGEIMKQSISSGTMVPYGTPIAVTVSLGSEMCTVPNVIGMTVKQADEALSAAGLKLGEQTEEYSDTVEQGKVIELVGTSVGSRMKRGSYVPLKVSLGKNG